MLWWLLLLGEKITILKYNPNMMRFAQKREKHPWRSVTFSKVATCNLQPVTDIFLTQKN